MSAPSYQSTKEELINKMRGTAGSGQREFDIAKAFLDAKLQEDMIKHTENMVIYSYNLTRAT